MSATGRRRRALRASGRGAAVAGGVLLLSACGRLDELTYQPETTPEQWCDQRPCVEVGDRILNEPLGTFLVFLLAGLWVAAGIYFLRTRRGQRSRQWLGIALILGGIGAALAGVSYQAFSYELKCAGLDVCRLTNGWEVGYSLTQACSVSAMLIAVAHACTTDRLRRGLIVFAVVNAVAYLVVTIVGVLVPSAVLLSFAVLMLFALPGILIVIVVAGRRYRSTGDPMDRSLVVAAVLLVAVQVAYFAYYAAGITAVLWDDGTGFYFSENDVLHIGMILWLWYVVAVVGRQLRDASSGTAAAGG
ncbi:MAG: hypothetical protein MUF09_02415 [Candidatus Nanopelagicales bacterium]|jgi:hypothetical protein|nr:hypothetical protein [Candidatus Nanopelagicales bacterium]